ncbi:MAG: type II toxin-antitoxin system RelE/ParE family toxin [Magnetococcales bacterium]|nr:type II toxin-antitoxin system RelE/ParE family toxin [Magnetococcales bacterium]
MIKTFSDKRSAAIFAGIFVKGFPSDVAVRARMRLIQIHWASRVDDLRLPPSNHLETHKGDRQGQWSIRINSRWRICFRFAGSDAFDVEIVDYR